MIPAQSKKVAIYCRVSTTDQNIETQLTDLRRYSYSRGWIIHKEYLDIGVSGSKENRPSLDALMTDSRQKLFDIILVWRFDRFARSSRHLALALDEFGHLGIDFVSYNEHLDTSGAMGKAMFTIIGAMAELERGIISERVRAGLRRAREKGKVFGRPRVEIPQEKLRDMQTRGYSVRKMSMALGIARSTVQDKLAELKPGVKQPSESPPPVLVGI